MQMVVRPRAARRLVLDAVGHVRHRGLRDRACSSSPGGSCISPTRWWTCACSRNPMFTVAVVLTVMLSFAQYGANLLNPIFLQEYMGYTAWRAGLTLAPRAFGTVFSLILVGQLARYRFQYAAASSPPAFCHNRSRPVA